MAKKIILSLYDIDAVLEIKDGLGFQTDFCLICFLSFPLSYHLSSNLREIKSLSLSLFFFFFFKERPSGLPWWVENRYRYWTLTFHVAQWKRICLPMQEMWVWSLGQEDALEKEITSHSSILAWRVPWTEEPDGYSPCSCKKSDMT